jgi:hypothetical protein
VIIFKVDKTLDSKSRSVIASGWLHGKKEEGGIVKEHGNLWICLFS